VLKNDQSHGLCEFRHSLVPPYKDVRYFSFVLSQFLSKLQYKCNTKTLDGEFNDKKYNTKTYLTVKLMKLIRCCYFGVFSITMINVKEALTKDKTKTPKASFGNACKSEY
jgi:hypothetical protein